MSHSSSSLNEAGIDVSIIIPTYNEKNNIKPLISRINKVLDSNKIKGEIIIVDDDSPDNTAKFAQQLTSELNNLKVIVRKNTRGLSSAVVHGFNFASGSIFVVMDADLSHPPEVIPKLIKPILSNRAEITIGSRYIRGGGVENWTLKREVLSKLSAFLGRLVVFSVTDPMSGFFALKREVIKGVKLNPIGYKIGLEILAKGNYERISEVPYVFADRKFDKSKLTLSILMTAFVQILLLQTAKNSNIRKGINAL